MGWEGGREGGVVGAPLRNSSHQCCTRGNGKGDGGKKLGVVAVNDVGVDEGSGGGGDDEDGSNGGGGGFVLLLLLLMLFVL